VRAALPILAACLVAGCGSARSGNTESVTPDDPGVLVFGGTLNSNARHPPPVYYALRPDGAGLHKLAFSDTVGDLSFSADGRFAAMWETRGDENSVIVSRVDGSEARVVPLPADAIAISPSPSPDGNLVALAYAPNFDAPTDLWTIAIKGRKFTRLSSTGNVVTAAWSPDGDQIAFTDQAQLPDGSYNEGDDLYVIRADGTDLHRIPGSVLSQYSPAWSPDGTRIAFEDLKSRVSIVDVKSGTITVVSPDGEAPAWSPDGKRLAFLRVAPCRGYVACLTAKMMVVDLGRAAAPREVGPSFGQPRAFAWTSAKLLPAETSTPTVPRPNS
jgi:dipeptidyl aminopeptidase/acylaminoacyl peptidase